MWNALTSIQKGLDEAAGISTTPPPHSKTAHSPNAATASSLLAAAAASSGNNNPSAGVPIVVAAEDDQEDVGEWGGNDSDLDIEPYPAPQQSSQQPLPPQSADVEGSGAEEEVALAQAAPGLAENTTIRSPSPPPAKAASPAPPSPQAKVVVEEAVAVVAPPQMSGDGQLWRGRFDEAKSRWRKEKNLNQQLVAKVSALELQVLEQVNINTELAAAAAQEQQNAAGNVGNAARESALIEEGKELSKNLGLTQEKLHELELENYQQADLIEALEKKVQDLTEKEKRMKENQKHSSSTEAAMQEQAKMLQESMTKYVTENETLKASNTELLSAMEQQKNVFTSELQAINERHHFNETQVGTELEQLREVRRREAADHDQKLQWMQDELSGAHRRAHEAESRGADSQQEISAMTADLRQQLQSADSKMMIFKNSLEAVERENLNLDKELKVKRSAVGTLEAEKMELKGQLSEMKRCMTQATQRCDALESDATKGEEFATRLVAEHNKEKTAVDRHVKALKDEVAQLQQQLASAKSNASATTAATPIASASSSTTPAPASQSLPSSYLFNNSSNSNAGSASLSSSQGTSARHQPSSSQMQRLENELVKVNLQLGEAQASVKELTQQVNHLTGHNDELMIMYGEKVEELFALEDQYAQHQLQQQQQQQRGESGITGVPLLREE